MAATASAAEDQVRSIHQYKITPPTYDGDFSTFEEWKYKFTAYIGLINPIFPRLLTQSERSPDPITDPVIRAGADTIEEGERWIRLASELQFILVNITKGPAATVCRQMGLTSNGLETWRQLVIRFSIPVGTRSIGYLTKLLKPSFDESKFEESFATWEFEINRYERDNSTILPDNIKIAVLLNETKGSLQQHLQLTASHVTDYQQIRTIVIEYYRAAASFSRMQQLNGQQPKDDKGPAPMDIGATWKGKNNKGKGKKGHHKGKGKPSGKGKGYGNNYYYSNKGKGKHYGPIGQGNPFKGSPKGQYGKGKPSGSKGKSNNTTTTCYKCGQQGHIARNCRVPIYNYDIGDTAQQGDPTYNWFNDPQQYDASWYNQDLTGQGYAQPAQLALPPPPGVTSPQTVNFVEEVLIAGIEERQDIANITQHEPSFEEIMIDSGAAAHVCPPWFGTSFPLHQMSEASKPQLRTVTDNNIHVYGYRWIHFRNQKGQHIVIPFYVCDVKHPILSVTRLIHQGFEINLKDNSTMTHQRSFESHITQRDGLLYIHLRQAAIPQGHQLAIKDTTEGQIAMIAPTTITKEGPQPMRGGNTDIWMFNNEGFIVRVHKRLRRALFTPDNTDCPIDIENLEDFRKTIIKQPGKPTAEFVDKFKDIERKEKNRIIEGPSWIGETWFRPKQGASAVTTSRPTTARMIEKEHQTPTQIAPAQASTRPASTPLMRAMSKQPERRSNIPDPSQLDKTSDYWIREGRMWKRVHIIPRNVLYCPEASDGGPSPEELTPMRVTFITPTDGSRRHRIDDEWTSEPQPRQATSWTGSTNFEEKATYKEHLESDDDEQQQAIKAKATPAPKQPSQQEIQEHNLTHMPYRSWCPICVQGKGRSTSHNTQTSRKPIIQIDFAYLRGFEEQQTVPILTAIDIETGLCMATMLPDKQQLFDYASNCIQTFIYEVGRTNSIIQSDNEPYLKALIQSVANKIGSISTRHSPAYSSQSQGSIERLHRTLFGQVRILREQIRQCYGTHINMKHPITPWLIRHSAFLINMYLIHSDGVTSYFRRWKSDNKTPICEFAETILYMVPGALKHQPKLENRFFKGIWLGKDTTSGESFIGIGGQVIKARTIRRQVMPYKYDLQLMDTINGTPWSARPSTYTPNFIIPSLPPQSKPETTEKSTETSEEKEAIEDIKTGEDAPSTKKHKTKETSSQPSALPSASFAPYYPPARSPPGGASPTASPPRRAYDDSIAEGSERKQQKQTTDQQAATRPTEIEPPRSKARINAVTVHLKNGKPVTTATCEDPSEAKVEQRLLEPIIKDHQGFDPIKMKKGMMKEMSSMVNQGVFEEITREQATPEELQNIIGSKWVHREKGDEVRCRIVGLGYDENIKDEDDIYASTPLFAILRVILAIALAKDWLIKVGDISTAFLHALVASATGILLRPPKEFYPEGNILWRLKKAMYGLRSSPKAWQDHLASILQQLGYIRLVSEPNVFKHPKGKAYIMVYVDDLLFVGEPSEVNKIFEEIQKHLLLRETGIAHPGKTISFLGRKITHQGSHFDITLGESYVQNILEEAELTKCNPSPTPGSTTSKETVEDEELLDIDQHRLYRRLVGKLQWLSYTRPDMAYSIKELARAIQQPSIKDQKKLKHCIRYLAGTSNYKFSIRPTIKINSRDSTPLDLNIFVDSDWAGCHQTRKSTTGFIIQFLGTTIHFGSRTQAVVALSSAEAEFYAIGTGTQEGLYIRNFLQEALVNHKIIIKINTDSTAGKSMATRQGVSKRAKHIELKFMFIQQLVQDGIISIHKVPTKDNLADILTKYTTREVLQWLLYGVGINQH